MPWLAAIVVGTILAGVSGVARAAADESAEEGSRNGRPTTKAAEDASRPAPVDDELVRKLLQRAAGEGDDEEVMQRVMRLMEASRMRLAAQFDPGEQTQRVQRRILEDLEEAVKRSRRRNQSSRQKQQQQKPGERRQRGRRQQQQGQRQKKNNKGAADRKAGENEAAAKGEPTKGHGRRTVRDRGRQWGNLPPRDRDAVLQGIKDEYLPKFKEMIERYYKALSKPEHDRR